MTALLPPDFFAHCYSEAKVIAATELEAKKQVLIRFQRVRKLVIQHNFDIKNDCGGRKASL